MDWLKRLFSLQTLIAKFQEGLKTHNWYTTAGAVIGAVCLFASFFGVNITEGQEKVLLESALIIIGLFANNPKS